MIDVQALAPGRYATVDTEMLRYFVIRLAPDQLHVVAVPMQEGATAMPEVHWWKPLINCKDFGLDAANGAISSQSQFCCHDTTQPAKWAARWHWDIHGQHIAISGDVKIDNMYRVRFERSGSELTFTGLDVD